MFIRVKERVSLLGEGVSFWDAQLSRCEQYSYFQTPQWSSLLCRVLSKAQPVHQGFHFSDGREAALPMMRIPKKWGLSKLESLPWGTYGGLIGEGVFSEDHYHAVATAVLSLRCPILEMSLGPCVSEIQREPAESRTAILALDSDFEKIWRQRFQARNRTAIRRAREEGVRVAWSNSPDVVESMRALYQKATRRWSGVETLPREFFTALTNLPGEEVRIWLAQVGDVPVAGDVILYGKGEVQYFAGAADLEYSKWNAPKFLMSEIIRDACERHYAWFNMGRSGGLEGVERFKQIFGAESVALSRRRLIHPFYPFAIPKISR